MGSKANVGLRVGEHIDGCEGWAERHGRGGAGICGRGVVRMLARWWRETITQRHRGWRVQRRYQISVIRYQLGFSLRARCGIYAGEVVEGNDHAETLRVIDRGGFGEKRWVWLASTLTDARLEAKRCGRGVGILRARYKKSTGEVYLALYTYHDPVLMAGPT